MTTLANGKIHLDRSAISALARRISAASHLPHAKAIDLVASALGYTGGNALMGALKNTEKAPETSGNAHTAICVPSDTTSGADFLVHPTTDTPAGYLHEVSFFFVSEEPQFWGSTLADIDYQCSEGTCVGQMRTPIKTQTPIDSTTLGLLAAHFGSTADFFSSCDDENPEDDQGDTGED